MTAEECYREFGGDYAATKSRLMSDRLIEKFLGKFLSDGSFALLEQSLQSGDLAEAFRAAHTLKGVCQNLGMDRLYASSSAACEELRAERAPAPALVAKVKEDYLLTCGTIRRFLNV